MHIPDLLGWVKGFADKYSLIELSELIVFDDDYIDLQKCPLNRYW